MDIDFKGKSVVITGASRGIGRIIAQHFAAANANVALWARNKDALDRIKTELKNKYCVRCESYKIDLCDFKSIDFVMKKTYEDFGRIDILVNNAGIPEYGYSIDDPRADAEETFRGIIELNFMAYWYTIRAVVPFMKRNGGGVVVNISSARGHGGVPKQSVYCAMKAAVIMLTKALAVELAPYNIRVVSVSPGAVELEDSHWILRRFGAEYYKEYLKRFYAYHKLSFLANQPLQKIGKADDVAWAVLFLASEKARFITGVDLPVDGGETAILGQPTAVNLELYAKLYREKGKLLAWIGQIEKKSHNEGESN